MKNRPALFLEQPPFCLLGVACALLFVLAGCAIVPPATPSGDVASPDAPTVEEPIPGGGPHVSPYVDVIVSEVDVRMLPTSPAQVELVIRGTLPDQCQYDYYTIESRQGAIITISIKGIHLPQTDCAPTTQEIETILPLGRDLPENERGFAPGTYELIINEYQTTFMIP